MVSWNFYPLQDIGLHFLALVYNRKVHNNEYDFFSYFCNKLGCFSFYTGLVYQERVTELTWSVLARPILNLPAEVSTF